MIKKAGMLLLAGGIAVSSLLVNVDGQSAEAAPLSLSSDTGAEVLNYVENERRQAREDALTEDQKHCSSPGSIRIEPGCAMPSPPFTTFSCR